MPPAACDYVALFPCNQLWAQNTWHVFPMQTYSPPDDAPMSWTAKIKDIVGIVGRALELQY